MLKIITAFVKLEIYDIFTYRLFFEFVIFIGLLDLGLSSLFHGLFEHFVSIIKYFKKGFKWRSLFVAQTKCKYPRGLRNSILGGRDIKITSKILTPLGCRLDTTLVIAKYISSGDNHMCCLRSSYNGPQLGAIRSNQQSNIR